MFNNIFKSTLINHSIYQNDEGLLLSDCSKNVRSAQEYLYKRYFQTLYYMCNRYCSDSDKAISIINDGMMKVYKNIHLYEQKGSLEGWIRKIVFHTLSDHFRKENRRIKFISVEDVNHVPLIEVSDKLDLEELHNMIEALPKITKEVFVKFAIEGFSHKEIGAQLGLAEGTSKWHLSKAREILKEMINKEHKSFLNAISK